MIKRRFHQLVLLGALLLVILIGINSSSLKRIDLIFYDSLIEMSGEKPPDDIVIIAIDEPSIAKLGRWPWPRHLHADLLTQLTDAQVKVVGFDILFSEPETARSDEAFAKAIAQHGRVILAVAPEQTTSDSELIELLPIPTIAVNSAGIGHVDSEIDIDGICRRIYLYAGLGDAHWPALGLALYQNYLEVQADLPFDTDQAEPSGSGWLRKTPFLIPFSGPPGHIPRYSYIDVLNGEVGAEELAGKIALVGATAVGMGDAISTPVSGHHQRMPGVELNANVTVAFLNSKFIHEASTTVKYLLSIALVILLLPLSKFLPRRYYPLCLPIAISCSIALCITLFQELRFWFPPSEAMLLQVLFFAVLSWRRYNLSQRKISQLNQEVYQRLNFDPLTHLPNREMLKDQLVMAIEETATTEKFALLVIQLSGIKEVNDRLGITAGDNVLIIAADQIKKAVDHKYPVARLGGIEFAVLLPKQKDIEEIRHIGRRLLQLLQSPYAQENEHFFLSPSIGISIYPDDGNQTEILLSNAFTAMHKAKSNHKRELYFYSSQLKKEIVNESALTSDLHLALHNNQFEVYYQPQVLSETGQIVGLEALLRWNHPERGLVSPLEFIPLAEKTGLIIPIGEWVMASACRQVANWNIKLDQPIRIAVNLSALQFSDDSLTKSIENILNETQLPAEFLEIELTESALMQDYQATVKTLVDLKSMGVKIAIDDFGTGYSSLSYLKQFPLDRIKIDQSFVRDLDESVESTEITQAIITMAHNLNLTVLAEGVETPQQRGFLLNQSCEELQGFFFSRPLPAERIDILLQRSLYISPTNSPQKPN